MENFLRPYIERHPASWSQHLALAEFVANNTINVAIGYTLFYLNSGDHLIVPSILLHGGDVSSHVEAVQTIQDSRFKLHGCFNLKGHVTVALYLTH